MSDEDNEVVETDNKVQGISVDYTYHLMGVDKAKKYDLAKWSDMDPVLYDMRLDNYFKLVCNNRNDWNEKGIARLGYEEARYIADDLRKNPGFDMDLDAVETYAINMYCINFMLNNDKSVYNEELTPYRGCRSAIGTPRLPNSERTKEGAYKLAYLCLRGALVEEDKLVTWAVMDIILKTAEFTEEEKEALLRKECEEYFARIDSGMYDRSKDNESENNWHRKEDKRHLLQELNRYDRPLAHRLAKEQGIELREGGDGFGQNEIKKIHDEIRGILLDPNLSEEERQKLMHQKSEEYMNGIKDNISADVSEDDRDYMACMKEEEYLQWLVNYDEKVALQLQEERRGGLYWANVYPGHKNYLIWRHYDEYDLEYKQSRTGFHLTSKDRKSIKSVMENQYKVHETQLKHVEEKANEVPSNPQIEARVEVHEAENQQQSTNDNAKPLAQTQVNQAVLNQATR